MAADLTIFDADTVQPLPEDIVHDFPNNGWRIRERAQGIAYTVVNGTVLIEHGEHTVPCPDVFTATRSTLYNRPRVMTLASPPPSPLREGWGEADRALKRRSSV